jgi:hypothetical protein
MTASPENEEHWAFPRVELTEYEKRLIVATIVKIGVLVMMNTHIYSWNWPPQHVRCCEGGDE